LLASENGHNEVVEYLLSSASKKQKTMVDVRRLGAGKIALMLAAQNNHTKVFETLLKH
jgi:ankyrin repeat protein